MARKSITNPLGLGGSTYIAAMLIFGVGGYLLYYKKLPPFTESNMDKLKEFLKPKETEEEETTPTQGLPPGATPLPGHPQFEQPSAPLTTPQLTDPQVKPDESIRQDFIREIYKQVYLPYDQYPFLYSQGQFGYNSPNAPNGQPYGPGQDPGGFAYNYRPPIRGGDVPANAPDADQWFNEYYKIFGMYPPGGGYTYPYYDQPSGAFATRQFLTLNRKPKDVGYWVRSKPKKSIGQLQRELRPLAIA